MTTTTVTVRVAQRFHALHHEGAPLQLVNAWDALSARVAELAGASAIGTSSFAAALARGYPDGERIPWPEALGVVAEVAHAVEIPVTADMEAGRGASPEAVVRTVEDVLEAGAVGVNLEDSRPEARTYLADDADAPSADAPLEPAFHLIGDLAFRGQ